MKAIAISVTYRDILKKKKNKTTPELDTEMTSGESRVGNHRSLEQLKQSFRNKISYSKRRTLFISMNSLKCFTCSCY